MKEETTKQTKNVIMTLIVCATIVALSLVGSSTYFNLNDRELMAENINKAIEKGVDPMSVRCSYANGQDLICVAFATSSSNPNVQSFITKK